MSATEALPPQVMGPLYRCGLALVCFACAVVLWTGFAPLATTLSVGGKLVSARPAVQLQHPYGGQIAAVPVKLHQHVAAGDLLMRLDVRLELAQARALQTDLAQLRAENDVIDNLLEGRAMPDQAADPYQIKYEQAQLQHHSKQASAVSLDLQVQALAAKLVLAESQRELLGQKEGRQSKLSEKGLLKQQESDSLQERILITEAEIEKDRADLAALQDRAAQARHQADLVLLQMQETLASTRRANSREMAGISQQLRGLQDRIDQAELRAPIAAQVTELPLQTADSYAARGATLVGLSQPLDQPHVAFDVPVSHIDQVLNGMTGRLVLTSLPQRSMPVIDVQVTTLSARADLNEQGQPVSYAGRAQVVGDGLDRLQHALGEGNLIEDMPVQVILSVRETTFAQYLLAPLTAAFGNALQD